MYDRQINGKEYTFGVSGKLIRNVLVMYDRQTESYWSQLLGESVEGELIGTKLEFVPSWMTTWEAWQAMHPDTVALNKGGRRGARDTYTGYYSSPSAGVIGETTFDTRLDTKEFVIGVELANTAVAYPFRVLNEQPIVNDVVGEMALLVVFDSDTANGVVFDRQLNDQLLTFSRSDRDDILVDAETGSTWDAFSGVALSGPLSGEHLMRIKSTAVFWFGWKDFHTDTAVYGLDG